MVLKNIFRSTVLDLRTWSVFLGARKCNTVSPAFKPSQCRFYANWTLTCIYKSDEILLNQAVRQYARPSRKKQVPKSASGSASILAEARICICPTCTISEKLSLKEEQLIAKVQRGENDRSSTEVKVAILTARIRNFQEHLHKHPKDKANKRWMLMAIDSRKKKLKFLRRTRYDSFKKVCQELGITYTFPPEYYRRVTRRWLAKKAFCNKVFQEVQKQKKEQREKQRSADPKGKEPTSSKEPQGTA
ncbi:28S ribosomal protein S15, mitochondrial isoform X2 [Cyprinus carpio]|uniref:28S ribosomal protein S15, mitochondrial isoform X2 n=1 Tax=Cyprinus carpio TaxID=7962 RepID=A0A9R0BB92_CYPCA|nr:28S ribosomal protein S15, mitochondrial isoform X2 [Cyprinus carpio]